MKKLALASCASFAMMFALTAGLAACGEKKPADGPGEAAGQKVDEAAKDTKEATQEAAKDTKEATQEAADDTKDAAKKATKDDKK